MNNLEDQLKTSDQVKQEFIEAFDSYISKHGVDKYISNMIDKTMPEYKVLRGEVFR